MRILTIVAVAAALAAPAAAAEPIELADTGGPFPAGPFMTVIDTFDGGVNLGNWSFFGNPANPIEIIDAEAGPHGAFLRTPCDGTTVCLDSFAPPLRTQLGVPSMFLGDYRATGVASLAIDVAIFGPPGVTTGNRPLTLILVSDNGTPDDFGDDIWVNTVNNHNIPAPNGHWQRYTYRVPSASETLPPGWAVNRGTGDDDADWNEAMKNVSQVRFFFGDLELFYIFQNWDIGVDNIRIARGGGGAAALLGEAAERLRRSAGSERSGLRDDDGRR